MYFIKYIKTTKMTLYQLYQMSIICYFHISKRCVVATLFTQDIQQLTPYLTHRSFWASSKESFLEAQLLYMYCHVLSKVLSYTLTSTQTKNIYTAMLYLTNAMP